MLNACTQWRPAAPRRRAGSRGFSLVELMIGVAVMGLLSALAAPAFGTWMGNAQVRTAADTLQSGLRLGQAEAVRRYRQVVLFRTTSPACDNTVTASAAGNAWALRTVALVAGDPIETIRCGAIAEGSAAVAVTGPTALCFSSGGRQVANPNPGAGGGASCTLPVAGAPSAFNVSGAGSNRPLRVVVTLGGSVRMCDPARALGSSTPEGCP